MSDTAPVRVALTFDAEHPDRSGCPADSAQRILDNLRAREARATFFVQGRWAESQPALAHRIATDGHLIGHHSFYHARMPLLHDEGIAADVHDGEAAIVAASGVDPRPWFRCPFGEGRDDPRVVAILERLGYRNVHWNVVLEDWEPDRTGEAITRDALDGVRAHGDGAVVLLHTWPRGTADAVGPLVDGLRERGATLVTVADLELLP